MHYSDTSNHFSIGIPEGWHYAYYKNSTIKLIVNRLTPAADTLDKAHENFNINIINEPLSSLEKVYNTLFSALKSTDNFTLIGQGDTVIAGRHFKWLRERHLNDIKKDSEIANYDFVTYENSKAYILTFTALSSSFTRFEALFFTIAQTFTISGENIALNWPPEEHFKIVSNEDNLPFHTMQMLPANETVDKWTTLATVISLENFQVPSIEAAIKIYTDESVQASPLAKCTILSKSNEPGKQYALFKVETSSFHNTGKPDSQVYYIRQGQGALFICLVEIKQPLLNQSFADKWAAVFMSSKLYRD